MLIYPEINPVAFTIPLPGGNEWPVMWYGMMYLVGVFFPYLVARQRAKYPWFGWTKEQVSEFAMYTAFGIVLGGRIGYMLFYNFSSLLDNPLSLFFLWQGGMSFHGGLIGVAVANILFAKHYNIKIINVIDMAASIAPIGLFAGRMGNFINAELYGRVTDAPIGMLFPEQILPRHPSQLYEAALEGLLLFVILMFVARKERPPLTLAGVFLMGYGSFRAFVELFREPDAHLGFLAFDWLTMGQILSLPMILLGFGFILFGYIKARS